MKKHNGNVLVLGHGDRAFLSVIRSLGRAGLKVHVGMCAPDDIALKSRYVAKWHDVPVYQPGDSAWLDAMEAILAETPFQLVIPCDDQGVIPLQTFQERLSRLSKVYVLGDKAYEIAFSKIESSELADKLGIPQPKTAILRADDDCESIRDLRLPVVVKPPSSFTSEDLTSKRGVVRCRTNEQLYEELANLGKWGGAIVQENFIGVGVGVELLAQDGDVLVAFQHVRVHEPLEGGGSSYRRSAELNPALLAAAKSIIRELDYTGVAMVEFKFDFESGQWVFIEINGRFWGSLPLSIAAGVDFPLYLYEMLVQGRREFPQGYRVPLFCRNIASDQRWLRSIFAANRSDPLLATRQLRSVALEPLNLLLFRERWDTLVIDDPVPGMASIASIAGDGLNKITSLCRRRLDDSLPVRKWRRSRILQNLRPARTIVFVCKGNICRSPFAEHYARRILPSHITVHSCGYYPVRDRPSPEVAQRASSRFGIDLSDHRSQVISEELLREADLVFAFDEQNRDVVLRRFSFAYGRVFGLGILCSGKPIRIADPYGKDASEFETVYGQISEAIDHLSAGLSGVSEAHVDSSRKLNRGSL